MARPVFPELRTARLVLRELHAKDVPRLSALLQDEEVTRYIGWGPIKHRRKFIRGMRKNFLAGRELHWGICEKEGGALMGVISLHPIDRANQRAMAGFWLGRDYWHRGYAAEAFRAVLTYCFDELNLNRVWASHLAGNEASGRVQQKCGLRYEGTQRQHHGLSGRCLDLLLYGILKEDFANPSQI
ncbi:MAG: GNAT family N-acetyltransferase [Firmicutes bacterium]|nr:GNAT family N-acetyltransferase [Bacillota bacterium]